MVKVDGGNQHIPDFNIMAIHHDFFTRNRKYICRNISKHFRRCHVRYCNIGSIGKRTAK